MFSTATFVTINSVIKDCKAKTFLEILKLLKEQCKINNKWLWYLLYVLKIHILVLKSETQRQMSKYIKKEIFLMTCKCDFSYLALRNTAYVNHSCRLSFMIVAFFVTLKKLPKLSILFLHKYGHSFLELSLMDTLKKQRDTKFKAWLWFAGFWYLFSVVKVVVWELAKHCEHSRVWSEFLA